ncbi:MAG: FxLYD domain-containing protein [Candidatus Hydrothermarchaeales archaeon]
MRKINSTILGVLIFFSLVYGIVWFSSRYQGEYPQLIPKVGIATTQPPIVTPMLTTALPKIPEAEVGIKRWEKFISDSGDYINIVGEVENIGDGDALYVKVIARYYDSSNKVVFVDGSFADEAMLSAGKTTTFEIKTPYKPEIRSVELEVTWE